MSEAADVYSAGALLFHFLDGGPPFDAKKGAVTEAHATGTLPPPRLPTEETWAGPLAPIATRAMATDPAQRYATASEMSGALRAAVTTHVASPEHTSIVLHDLCGGAIRRRRTRFLE